MHILLVAAENDGIYGGKVGGVGDVLRDIAAGLGAMGCTATTVLPSYGFLHHLNPSRWIGSVGFPFGGSHQTGEIYQVQGRKPVESVQHFVLDHPLLGSFDAGPHRIYTHDPPDRPYATDAAKFALFCSAAASALVRNVFGDPDCIHLHDWHAAFVLMLRKFHEGFKALNAIRIVYTIHNLAFQGVRPFRGSRSSLEAWYPELRYNRAGVSDPRWPACVNPMAAGIRMADAVHTVSPSYAREILAPSCKPHRFSGGEGLEKDLRSAENENRFFGILNGCDYPEKGRVARRSFSDLLAHLRTHVLRWSGTSDTVAAAQFLAYARLRQWAGHTQKPSILLTSIGRIVEQKMLLMRESGSNREAGLEAVLKALAPDGLYILLGEGDRAYTRFFTEMMAKCEHFIFLNGYSEDCADALYANGDLFLMPSSFEPCGIGQMRAMRDGQPCVVHAVGGLKDTVVHGVTGFTFTGDTVSEQVDNFIRTTLAAIAVQRHQPEAWQKIRQNASSARFLWKDSLRAYMENLYTAPGSAPARAFLDDGCGLFGQ